MNFTVKFWRVGININLFDLDLSDGDIKFTVTVFWR